MTRKSAKRNESQRKKAKTRRGQAKQDRQARAAERQSLAEMISGYLSSTASAMVKTILEGCQLPDDIASAFQALKIEIQIEPEFFGSPGCELGLPDGMELSDDDSEHVQTVALAASYCVSTGWEKAVHDLPPDTIRRSIRTLVPAAAGFADGMIHTAKAGVAARAADVGPHAALGPYVLSTWILDTLMEGKLWTPPPQWFEDKPPALLN